MSKIVKEKKKKKEHTAENITEMKNKKFSLYILFIFKWWMINLVNAFLNEIKWAMYF